MYVDKGRWVGTRMTAILDEIRKIGNVRSDVKVISYVTSIKEIETGRQIADIQNEIRLIRDSESLTRKWVVLQIGRYVKPASRKALPMRNNIRHVFIRMTELDGKPDEVAHEDRLVPAP